MSKTKKQEKQPSIPSPESQLTEIIPTKLYTGRKRGRKETEKKTYLAESKAKIAEYEKQLKTKMKDGKKLT